MRRAWRASGVRRSVVVVVEEGCGGEGEELAGVGGMEFDIALVERANKRGW